MVATHHPLGLEEISAESWSVLERLGRALHLKNAELQPTLDGIVALAVQTISSAQYAGLILVERGQLRPQSTAGAPPHALDMLQQAIGTGPCIDAAREQAVIRIRDTSSDQRWPAIAEQAASLGVASMLCVPLWVDESRLGSLSLYSSRSSAFSDHDLQLTRLYATHAALALSDAQRVAKLQTALRNRDVIGQAKGILMERSRLTPEGAFERLSQASQTTNLKLATVAQHLVDTGELPVVPSLAERASSGKTGGDR